MNIKDINKLMANGKYDIALSEYIKLSENAPDFLKKILILNIEICKQRLKKTRLEKKIAVVIHVFYIDIFEYILEKLKDIKIDFIITTNKDKIDAVNKIAIKHQIACKILEIDNGGYDIYPFLRSINYILDEKYDYVCKLHTKKGLANLENIFSDEYRHTWLDMLMDPILKNQNRVEEICNYLSDNSDVAMVGSADFYKSAKWLAYNNEIYISKILHSLKRNLDPARDFGFFAGSIFWIRVDDLKSLLPLLDSTLLNDHLKLENKTGEFSSFWHAFERIFGVIGSLSGKENAIIYSGDINSENISIIKASHSRIPNGSPYGVGGNIDAFINFKKNSKKIRDSGEFNFDFYKKNYKLNHLNDDEILHHYLRYGSYERCNPNINFSTSYYWEENRDVSIARQNAFVHYLLHGRKSERVYFPAEENFSEIKNILKSDGRFDAEFYLKNNPDVKKSGMDPLDHYIRYGYLEKRQPCNEKYFDQIWYIQEYLQSWRTPVNPLLQNIKSSKKRRVLNRPDASSIKISDGVILENQIKRVCLFAGYDKDGIIDDYVIDLVKELSIYADVYYLADSEIAENELSKIRPYTINCWAFRHGEYDFGSYMRLCRYLVGWEKIRSYDELLLVNDSGYLIDSLSNVFRKMEKQKCDWWGLQATKGISATKDNFSNKYKEKISLSEVLEKKIFDYENDDVYDFLIGSYFLAFRKPLLEKGGELEKIINSVKKEKNKKNIILSYEIGITRRLIQKGFRPSTFIDYLHTFHPIYTKNHFELIADGFPLLKRFFLTENHYHVPKLRLWKNWLKEIKPNVDLGTIEKNLLRVADASKLYVSLNHPDDGSEWPQPLIGNEDLQKLDSVSKVDSNCWVFPVCAYTHNLSGNDRMVFEGIKNNPEIKKIILYRSKNIDFDGVNVESYPLMSVEGQKSLINSGYIFIKHSTSENIKFPIDFKKHKVVNLWHGIPLKRIGYASLDLKNKLDVIYKRHSECYSVICSSKIDKIAMASAFYPLSYHDVWLTGLPRNDVILMKEPELPKVYMDQLSSLKLLLNGRKLVLYAPTFRNAQHSSYYKFSKEEVLALYKILHRNNAVLGIREHMADKAQSYSSALIAPDAPVVNLGGDFYPDIEVIYRITNLLITDYSSCFIDFMLTGRPVISFAFDLKEYRDSERGFFYDIEYVFPGPIHQNFSDVLETIEKSLKEGENHDPEIYQHKRNMFFEKIDAENTKRLIAHVFDDMKA